MHNPTAVMELIDKKYLPSMSVHSSHDDSHILCLKYDDYICSRFANGTGSITRAHTKIFLARGWGDRQNG